MKTIPLILLALLFMISCKKDDSTPSSTLNVKMLYFTKEGGSILVEGETFGNFTETTGKISNTTGTDKKKTSSKLTSEWITAEWKKDYFLDDDYLLRIDVLPNGSGTERSDSFTVSEENGIKTHYWITQKEK